MKRIEMSIGDFVYLDHNATTLPRAAAVEAMVAALSMLGNPSSIHRAGRDVRQRLAAARDAIASAIVLPYGGDIVFTSGGTEANLLAINGLGGRRVLHSAIEHDSVRAARADAEVISVLPTGVIDLAALAAALDADTPTVVSVMAANNETGVIQPIAEVVALAHARNALVHCDAAQAVGKIPFDMTALGVDLVSISAHKIGGPQGVGAVALRPDIDLTALQRGGGQEKGRRAGTENMPGILGFATAIRAAVEDLEAYAALTKRRDTMERHLLEAVPDAVVFGDESRRIPNTSCVALPGTASEIQIMALDLAGIGVSAGSACSSGKVKASHVLMAMGVPSDLAQSAIRVSLGRDTTSTDIARFTTAWIALAARRKRPG